jgi:hypothetical protein
LWWSRYPDCKHHGRVVGLIVTAYRLLSRQHPRCLRCSTPHVVVFPFLCGSTLLRGFRVMEPAWTSYLLFRLSLTRF